MSLYSSCLCSRMSAPQQTQSLSGLIQIQLKKIVTQGKVNFLAARRMADYVLNYLFVTCFFDVNAIFQSTNKTKHA